MRYLAVDPDLTGAFAVVVFPGDAPPAVELLSDVPLQPPRREAGLPKSVDRIDWRRCRDILRVDTDRAAAFAGVVVEAPSLASPGRVAIGATHYNSGTWFGLLAGLGFDPMLVTAQRWQRILPPLPVLPRGGTPAERRHATTVRRDARKSMCRAVACRVFGLPDLGGPRSGRADALVLAVWLHALRTGYQVPT